MLGKPLFDSVIPIHRIANELLAKLILGERYKEEMMAAVKGAMNVSTFVEQAINFALHMGTKITWMSSQEVRNYANTGDVNAGFKRDGVNVVFFRKVDLVAFTGSNITREAAAQVFWSAFSNTIHTPYHGTRENCVDDMENAGLYPFTPGLLSNRDKHYKQVFQVYHDIASLIQGCKMFRPEIPPSLSEKFKQALQKNLLPLPLSDSLKGYLKEAMAGKMTNCDVEVWSNEQRDQCLILTALTHISEACSDNLEPRFLLKKADYSDKNSYSLLDLTNPDLFGQLPEFIVEILKTVQAAVTGNQTALEEEQVIMKILRTDAHGTVIHESLILLNQYTRSTITECDAILMGHSSLLSSLPSMQTLMEAHRAEVGKMVECNPEWVDILAQGVKNIAMDIKLRVPLNIKPTVEKASTNPALEVATSEASRPSAMYAGILFTTINIAFATTTTVLKRYMSESNYQKLTWCFGKPMKLLSHYNIATRFSLPAHANYMGAITFVMDEMLLALANKYGISDAPRMLSNSIAIAGMTSIAYEDPQTFVIAVGSGLCVQAIVNEMAYVYDHPNAWANFI